MTTPPCVLGSNNMDTTATTTTATASTTTATTPITTTTANLRAGDIGGPSFAVTRHRAATWQ